MNRTSQFFTAVVLICLLGCVATSTPASAAWKFAVFCDSRGSTNGVDTATLGAIVTQIVAEDVDLVIVPGDMVNSGDATQYQQWRSTMSPVYNAGIPVYCIRGNHETYNGTSGWVESFGADNPDNGPSGAVDYTYYFEHNNAMFVGIDHYIGGYGHIPGSWFTDTINNRSQPHLFVYGHEPAFKVDHTDCLDDSASERDTFIEDILAAGGKMYFCGHDHFLDILRADDGDGDTTDDFIQYLVGTGGAPLYSSGGYNGNNSYFTPVNIEYNQDEGYTIVDVDGGDVTLTHYDTGGSQVHTMAYSIPVGPEYNVYYGSLHNHSALSDGSGSANDAYTYARDTSGLDFFSLADHDYWPTDLTEAKYQTMKDAANSHNDPGNYVTFWGFEWTSDSDGGGASLGLGHVAVINSPDFCNATEEATNTLNELVTWMESRDCVAFFNHPGQYGTNFDNFNFNYSDQIVGMELWNRSDDYYGNGSWYHNALDAGFNIGATGSHDEHGTTWGSGQRRMAILAENLTRADLYAAMQARRFYSTQDQNLVLSFTMNGEQMGSIIEGGVLDVAIDASDGNSEVFTKIDLMKNGSLLDTWAPGVTDASVSTSVTGVQGDYFYVRVYQGGSWEAISSPIFITSGGSDVTPPTPDPMSFATAPYATGDSTIAMEASVATDSENGVEYNFICTAGGGNDSGWQGGTFYEDSGLIPETQYSYTVTARDTSGNQNQTAPSSVLSATTLGDIDPPIPDPMTWASAPAPNASIDGPVQNLVLPANGGLLESFTSEYGGDWVASDLTNGETNEPGWSSAVDPGSQEFIFSFENGDSATLNDAVIHGGTGEGSYYSKDVEVWTSADGTNYTLRGSDTLLDQDNDSVTINLGGVSATKIKLVVTSGYRTDYWEIAEFVVSGYFSVPGDPETEITMTATTATDPSGVEYLFECTAGPGHDSGWQDSEIYLDTGLTSSTQYSYTVTARDKSTNQNATTPSVAESATTDGTPPGDPVPDVVGTTQTAAEAAIIAAGFVVGTVSTEYSDTVVADYVISQNPTGGTSLPAGSSVDLVVSLGVQMVTVPDVAGMAQAAAEAAIAGAVLTVGNVTTAYSPTVPTGDVISQNPAAGASVVHDSAVDIVVSLGVEPVTVPDVVGTAQAAAEAAITAATLTVGTVTTANSDTVPADDVISQNPAGGASVAPGTAVDLVVSLGVQMVTVPDVVGMAQATAEAAIAGAVLTVGNVTTAYSPTVPAGDVISQSPAGGASVVHDSAVDIVVSLGVEPVTVPDVVGTAQATAEAAITAATLTVGNVTTAYSDTVAAGDVISQNPAGGASVAPGTSVDLVVSLGVQMVTVPDVVGMAQAAAEAAITGAVLTVGNVTTATSPTVPAGDVISQSPTGGASVVHDSAVDIVVSLGVAPVTVPDVVGTAQAAAEAAITAATLTVGTVTTAYSDTVAAGNVISQNPAGGASVLPGTAVDLVVSLGVQMVPVPDVTGMAQASAEAAITAAVLTVGSITTDYSETVAAGDVISQSPTGGTIVVHDTAVDILVSLGLEGAINVVLPANGGNLDSFTDEYGSGWVASDLTNGVTNEDGWASKANPSVPQEFVYSFLNGEDMTLVDATIHGGTGEGQYYSKDVEVWTSADGTNFTLAGSDVLANSSNDSVTIDLGGTVANKVKLVVTSGHRTDYWEIAEFVVNGTSVVLGDPIPDVVGMAQAAAEAAIIADGFVVGTVTTEYSDTVAAGDVISQNPAGGATAPAGSSVDIVVSLGVQMVTVPDVVGMAQASAEAAITGAVLTVGNVTTAYSPTVPAGDVISQNPAGGASVVHDSAVDLVVSNGPAPVTVPGVVGSAQAAAEAAIVAATLTVGNVTTAYSPTVPAGDVISQNPTGGASVAPGTAVDLVVSLGIQLVTVPDVTGMAQASAESTITSALLVVGNVTTANSDTVPAGDVISQAPTGGASIAAGSSVDIEVSLGVQMVTVPDVTDMAQAAAEAALSAAQLTTGNVTTDYSDTVAAGDVISQNPAGGASVVHDSAVDLVVSLGVQMVTVPDVVGMAQAAAEAAITAAVLTVGNVTTANSATVPVGDVISQNPAGGASAVHDSAVDIVVSLGVESVTVPDVVGTAQAAAEAAITAATLTVGTVTTEYSDTVAAGDVISQNPDGGASVQPGTSVDLVVSLGVQMVTVPDVVGSAQAAAEAAITGAVLTVGNVTTAYSPTIPAGDVISQNPGAGASVVHDSAVDLVVSDGPAPVTVPDVVGSAQAAAEAAIVAATLTVGNVTTAYSPTVPAGDVISQNPAGGASVAPGTSVDLVVSLGLQMVTVPDVVGMAQAAAESAITSALLVVGNVTTAYSDTVAAGDVISQAPTGGASIAAGSSVDIEVSLGVQMVTVPDVTDMAQAAAEAALTAAQLTTGNVTTAYSDTVAAGDVISQNPTAGASVVHDSAVDLVVSLGVQMVTVPDVVGMAQAAAEAAITGAVLTVGNVTTANSATVPAGDVISQNPTGGASVVHDSAVDLVISLGDVQSTTDDFSVAEDAYVKQAKATTITNNNDLRVREGARGKQIDAYLKFTVSGVGMVTNATLKLYSDNVNMGVDVYQAASNSWSESSIIWNNAPGSTGGSIDNVAVTTGWVEFDVTALVSGDGTYSFILRGDVDKASRDFSSSEGANPPVLTITHE